VRSAALPALTVLLGLALAGGMGAPPDSRIKLQRGDEFSYTGTATEVVDRPGTRLRRSHELTVRVFVLERQDAWADAAVLTLVRRVDDAPVAGVLSDVTGLKREEKTPPAARLDLVRIHDDGTVHAIAPLGPAPLRFSADTPAQRLPTPPLDTFAPSEFGMFAPRSKADDDSWTLVGHDFILSERCQHQRQVQHARDWEFPRGGQTSWHRADDVWLSANGMARRVKRTIRQRDGIATEPAVRIDVALDLKDQGRAFGRLYDRQRADIEVAYLAMAELGPLMKDAARVGSEPFKQRLTRIDDHLAATDPGTPFREAVLAVKRQLEAAKRGEAVAVPMISELVLPRTAALGRAAPEIQVGDFKLSAVQGRPVVLVFFMPGQDTTEDSLRIADALQKKFGAKITVASMSVFAPAAAGIRDRDRLKLAVPVYDGSSAEAAYGIETFPRFFVLDSAGTLRWTFAGVGNETGRLARGQVESLLVPPVATGSPSGPAGTAPSFKP
jgi:hypothetical protein